jgi:trans-aconitate methyltransferase
MQYQSFPGVKGSSESLEKLKALRLPSLKGKKFIDLGCNEGYFCGYALFAGAAEITGIDRSAAAIGLARSRFPECTFLSQSWEQLPDEKYDVILLLSALHYAEDQEALSAWLMRVVEGMRKAQDSLAIHRAALGQNSELVMMHHAHRHKLALILQKALHAGTSRPRSRPEDQVEAAMIVAEIEYFATAAVMVWNAAQVMAALGLIARRLLRFARHQW